MYRILHVNLSITHEKIFESFFVDVELKNKVVTCGCLYRALPADASLNTEFLSILDCTLKKIKKETASYLVTLITIYWIVIRFVFHCF